MLFTSSQLISSCCHDVFCLVFPWLYVDFLCSFFLVVHAGTGCKDEDVHWWGHKHGFVSGGFLGTTKSCQSKDSQCLALYKRKMFAEEDQENLYKLVQVVPPFITTIVA